MAHRSLAEKLMGLLSRNKNEVSPQSSVFPAQKDIRTLPELERHIETLPDRLQHVKSVYEAARKKRLDVLKQDKDFIMDKFAGEKIFSPERYAADREAEDRFSNDIKPFKKTAEKDIASLNSDAADARERVRTWGWSPEKIANYQRYLDGPYGMR